jgi:acetyl esterase/lipase
MQCMRRFYGKHQLWVKLGGVLSFLVVVASLYFFVLSGNASTGAALQTTPQQIGSGLTPTNPVLPTIPTAPPASPTPPLLPPLYSVKIHPNVGYAGLAAFDRQLDICTPVGAGSPRPGVLLIHDIGVPIEDKSVYTSLCSLLASQGFVAAAVNFRKYPNLWPDQLEDTQLAVRWLRANAGQYNLDPSRLCAWGDSMGAYLSVFLGVLGSNYPGDESALLPNQSSRVSCVVDDFGFVDLPALPNTSFWQSAFGFQFGESTPGVPLVTPAMLHNASPIFYVNSQSAPMYILHGTLDEVVPITQSQELLGALQQAGVFASYSTYPGGHGFSQLSPQQVNAIKLKIISYLVNEEGP